jgi:hypothetical protein
MTRIQTPINGISTTSLYQEGDCRSLVNLRPKNGALHPVSPRKELQELSQKYDIVFVHQNNGYKNWIGVVNSNSYSSVYFWDDANKQPQSITSSITGKVNSIQQIGNTLSLITESNIYYLYYQNDKYTYLDEMPQVPPIKIGVHTQVRGQFYYDAEYSSGSVNAENFIECTKGLVYKGMNNLVNGWTDSAGTHEGSGSLLFDACFIRYAFRLYDGSLTKHSPPILVMPLRNIVGREEPGFLDSIKSVAVRFDGTSILGPLTTAYVEIYGHNIGLSYDFSNLNNWKDIIQSVDIFMSAPLGVSNIENMRKDIIPSSITNLLTSFNLIKGISDDALKNVTNTSSFYFIKSIPLGTAKDVFNPDIFPSAGSDAAKMENLIYQEVMSDDNFSNHTYGAGLSYAYNSRLHLANVKTSFFKGFSADYFLWKNTDNTTGYYNGYKYSNAPGVLFKSLIMAVEINTGISNEIVYSSLIDVPYLPLYKMFMTGFISYPDPRAKRLTIYRNSDSKWYRVFSIPLEKHNFLNLSYYLSEGLSPVTENGSMETGNYFPDRNVSIIESNKIKVSDLNNPLSYPNKNTYTIGNGEILAFATIGIRIPEGSFGQYPLYVFTTNGIYALSVGSGDVLYSSQSTPTSYEIPTTGIICPTPFGVAFTSSRGICIISGQQVELLTPQLQQPPQLMVIQTDEKLEGVVLDLTTNFKYFLKGIEYILYNPAENELIIHNKDAEFNFVYCFDSRQFYQSTEKFDNAVQNAFPDLLVIDDKKIKDYANPQSSQVHVSLITRPLLFGTPDIKRLERMIVRANLFNIKNPATGKQSVLLNYYSKDELNFRKLRWIALTPSSRKDIDMGMFSRSKFSQFMLTFAGVVDELSEIKFIETEIEKEYQNTKMR